MVSASSVLSDLDLTELEKNQPIILVQFNDSLSVCVCVCTCTYTRLGSHLADLAHALTVIPGSAMPTQQKHNSHSCLGP